MTATVIQYIQSINRMSGECNGITFAFIQMMVRTGEKEHALVYEVEDMEAAVSGEENVMHLDYTKDVMEMMTAVRHEWGMKYPEEE